MAAASSTLISQSQPVQLDDTDKDTMVAVPIDQLQPEILEYTLWVDSVFYSIGVHAIIIGTIAPLYHHLNKGKDFNEFLEKYDCLMFGVVLVWYGIMAFAEVWFFNSVRAGRFLGRISHVFGFLAMFLILKLISLPLALAVFIPTLIWGIIVVVYSFLAIIDAYLGLGFRVFPLKV